MLESIKLKRNSVKSSAITLGTKKKTPAAKLVNPYAPFEGVDGKNYIIAYEDRFVKTTNCYAFAAGWKYPARNKYEDYIPGFLAGLPYSVENLENLVKGDLAAVGREVYEVIHDIPEHLSDGEGYWIKALYCSAKGAEGIHFMRKDKKSGRWIHKMGWEMPPKVGVRNYKFRDKKEALFDMPQMKDIPREEAEMVLQMMFPKDVYSGFILQESKIETSDSAGYTAINEEDQILQYDALWVMRVSEP